MTTRPELSLMSPACLHHVSSTLVVPRSCTSTLCATLSSPCQAPVSSTQVTGHTSLTSPHPNLVQYPPYSYNPYNAQYNQQYDAQHMAQVISHDENRVFVSDGHSWKEYNLEKVSSW